MRTFTKTLLIVILTLCVSVFAGCARNTISYGAEEVVRLEAGEPAPWTGWLLSDTELEFLLKQADP